MVDGVPILLDEVATTASELGIPPMEALKRLIGEQLLIREAERRGFDRVSGVSHVARQAAVQELLKRVVEPVEVGADEVARAYQEQRERFEIPEKRASLHVLFAMNGEVGKARDEAAKKHAQTAVAELLAASAPRSIWERYRALGKVDGFVVKAEEIPPVSRRDSYAPEYLDGLFSAAEPGVVPMPIRTSFGWHAIVVTEIAPAIETPLPEAHAVLRREMSEGRRAKALEALAREASKSHPVVRDEAAITAATHAQDQDEGVGAIAP